ncbi:homoserine O-succinyltransferase, partial [Lactobacillus delbrueckii subsp. bulgaricus]|nr:homoserine O-succinyltransferase [Lactobacillus delbrueckii subsp. bulgaricus]MBT8949270.1 homoserine O-succinyltransferase [Lactobacillus delbrueckii subsp. bulgaricus]MBT8959809.1 homoserine O-succinyltransferase [Lactobacillus delbrueckii subsp. bulgaricus]MBT8974587.1 homoserine O-succinyltransferase [Lactobacillus delbrueckii subsp. bulgaricus]MBT8996011.1 homoserine O-succinyltransferase [Lactobacillus delbrueckii subsp. bulgaricus]
MFSQIYLLFFKKGLTNKMSKKIGILNLMHDKIDTQKRFSHVIKEASPETEITYFYPQS